MPRKFNAFSGITGVAYAWKHHWKAIILTGIVVVPVLVVWRVLSGRNIIGGGRSTDATFLRPAVSVRKGWWNDRPGYQRAGLRCAAVAGLWLWTVAPVVVYVLLAFELVVLGLSASRRIQESIHERTVLRPLWPAVAGIIGIPESEPPARWMDIPRNYQADPTADDAEITVGLRAADADDERRVHDLVTLFDQRFSLRHHGRVDYAARLVHIRTRPQEPAIWPAVANILGVPAAALAKDWLDVEPEAYGKEPGAKVRITIPADAVSYAPFSSDLSRLVNQAFEGDWSARVYRADFTKGTPARVVLTRQAPPATPPNFVDFLAEHPDYKPTEPTPTEAN